ncbi:cation-translocating P-type ATPase [Mycolicibacterium vaccae]|uniref:P-type HAD superfamily ATPase n=1 Tax=Mycolicibacterium vaccae ATCC 25954 TaxID=1194972 RepID=K0UAN6_MYCVA|nr:cation-translocating P-type ATPase [Mycolicibacterium vaccae]ANI41499.1 ATPase [Mycolicibacterium vaccae 95051]EJZ04402.1 P-type HAD superfamily ATPase [Mycolicibacterium vaccae ATCC 25954]
MTVNLLNAPFQAAQTVLGVVREAAGGHPVRRSSSAGRTRWIEVRGLGTEDGSRIGAAVLAAVRAEAGVRAAALNVANSRVVVTVSEAGPGAAHLCRVVDDAEAGAQATTERTRPVTLPGDDELLAERLLAAAVSAAGIGPAVIGAVLGAGRFGNAVSLPGAFAEYFPLVRNQFERHLGRDATDLSVTVLGTAAGVLTASPAAVVHQTATRVMRAAEAINVRRSWQRSEPEIREQAIKFADQSGVVPRDVDQFDAGGAGVRYADRAAEIGLGAAALLGVASRDRETASAAALVATARPVRSITEAFACALGRGLTEHHGALVLRPVVLRRLDQIDTVVIDPRILYTDELAVTRVQGVDNGDRGVAWQAARAALADGALAPGWSPLAGIPGAGRSGEVLVSAIRDPWASALVTESRRAGARVVSLDDEGLRSLGQGFDDLRPATGGVDRALADTVAELSAGGARIALLTASTGLASTKAHVTVGVWRNGSPPPWDADILVPDLTGVWRVVHALPAARHTVVRGIEMSASASALGAVMLLPSVLGSGPVAGSVTATAALWAGYRRGEQVFDEALPHPEPGHDWHALPVDEVQLLLPRTQSSSGSSADFGPDLPEGLRPFTAAAARSWGLVSDFAGVVREDLADPITTILATGAAATALLGSPLDAMMVAAVQLLNTAISAEQTLHAERILSGLLAVQEPLARRLTGAGRGSDYEDVRAADLVPGDVIRVRAGEVIPADARIIAADAAEADESALTGESLPVAKHVDATPGAPLAERACMLYSGTTLVAGRVTAVVTAVGPAAQMNRVAAMTSRKARKVGLQAQLSRITNRALPWSLAGGGVVGVLSLLRGTPLHDAVAGGVAIAVAAVPEGLPLVVTLAQSAAARRLTSSSVLIRNPRAVEAFARLDVVCFDKTGTLSENRLRVTSVQPLDGVDATQLLDAAVHTVRPTTGQHSDHATDDAVRVAAADAGVFPGGTDARLPFQSDRPYAAALIGTRLSVKGAPEAVTAALADGRAEVTRRIDDMTAGGMRVLVVAERELTADQAAAVAADPGALADLCTSGMTPLGVIGMADTARASARPLLEELQARGIGVRLITGDHPVTAAVVAGSLGLTVAADEVMTGPEWERLTTEDRVEAARTRRVFARMAPEHKVQVVQALESADLVTAMVGDGANDAAAIRAATVGVGVVSAGSDPARTAADVLLLDGQIGALLSALDEGQQLWQRVSSAVSMLVGHNIGEVAFALITSLLMGRPALNARQILLINLLTDALPAAALAVSPQTGDQITGERSEAALWRAIWMRGASTATGGTLAWAFGRATGTPQRAATMGLIGLVLTQMGQTLTDSRGRLVVATNVGTLAVMAGVISTPGLSQVFGCRPVGPIGWAQAAAAAGIAGALPRLAPGASERIAEAVRSLAEEAREKLSVVDLQQARADQDGVDLTQRRGQQSHAGGDQRVGPDRAWNLRHVGQANQPGFDSVRHLARMEDEMWESARSFVADHRDVSKLVREAEKFSVQLPGIGRVRIPPPEQVAFYGVLGGLAAAQLIDWPIALIVGLGHAVAARQGPDRGTEASLESAPVTKAVTKAPAKKAPVKKAAAKKAPAKKTPVKKAAAKKTPVKKAAAKKTPAKKAAAKKAPAKKTP